MIFWNRLRPYLFVFQCFMVFLSCRNDTSVNSRTDLDSNLASDELLEVSLPPGQPEVVRIPYNAVGQASVAGQKPGKILRGGSWADQTEIIHRAANRLEYSPDTNPDYTVGFRCARDVE